ncbi:MAG: MinD/ParA family protein [Firmicutes bacterium]|nr:MinD/ParA family protein [Bacillota bacterium]
MEKIKVLVVDDVPQTRKDIIRLLYFEEDLQVVGEAGDGKEALQKIAELAPDVVLMDINMPVMDGITATEKISLLYPQTTVVIISIQGEPEYLKKAMVAGARDYLVKPLSSEEMALTIRAVHRQKVLHSSRDSQALLAENLPENGAQTPGESGAKVQEAKQPGQILVVFSGKGGVGKTTVATNLAVVLAQQEKKKVALLDLDLQFGDISVLLNLNDGSNISELVRQADPITPEVLDGYLIRHITGIDILPAPLFPQDAEYVSPAHTEVILSLLRRSYDYLVVDTPSIFNDITLQALEVADQILLLITRDIAAIKNAKTTLNILESLELREKVRIVLNRSDQDLGVDIPDLEKGLEITVAHQIVSDEKAVISAINKGIPVVISQASSEIARSFRRLGERTVNSRRLTMADKQGKSLITRIFSL